MVGTRVENDGEGRIPAVPGFQSGEMTWAVIQQRLKVAEEIYV